MREMDPSSEALLQVSSFSLKWSFLTWFEGLRTERVTNVQLVASSKANNVCDFELHKLDLR